MVQQNVADAASPPSASAARAPQFQVWSHAEAERFLSWQELPHYRRIAWELALATGMRREDLAGLRWQDYRDGCLNIENVRTAYRDKGGMTAIYEGPPKTDKGRRVIPLDPGTVASLDEWFETQGELATECGRRRPTYVLTTNDALPWNPDALGRAWRRDNEQAVEAGVVAARMRLHDTRHWTATNLIAAGEDLKTVSEILGHANAAFTLSVYAHTDLTRKQEAMNRLGGRLRRNMCHESDTPPTPHLRAVS
jgi:integrase